MKKAHGNMYDWIDWMCDPVKYCSHYCKYCYARRWLKKIPELNYKELHTIKPNKGKIFVGYMGDLFCEDMPSWIIETILQYCNEQKSNTYVLQTKNPERYWSYMHLLETGNYLLGITAETNKEIRHISLAPHPSGRLSSMIELSQAFNTFLTIEPILDFDLNDFIKLITAADYKFINIGADSKNHHLLEPSAEKVQRLIAGLGDIKVKLKSNLKRLGV